jgi:hypothetical protein
VVKDANGNILDGFHRKRVNPDWKEVVLPICDELMALRVRVHLNDVRRQVPRSEKEEWVRDCREILRRRLGREPTQREIAEAIGFTHQWVSEYDTLPNVGNSVANIPKEKEKQKEFFGYNVWGFKDDSWRRLVVEGDPNQPDVDWYHGATPAFVIHNLIQLYKPKNVLDSMAGIGTTGYVCRQYNIPCDMFDIYPFEKYGVKECDAEYVDTGKTYDLIFNHIPYLDMVQYGENPNDLSTMNEKEFMEKLKRIFLKNHTLLNNDGIYAVLVGDKRFGGKLYPLIAKTIHLGLDCDFVLFDEAVKITRQQKSSGLQEYRAAKYGYMAQTFDMVLIFKKG